MNSPSIDIYIPLAPGTILQDRYEILSLIGSGGMGAVYKAKHNELNIEVAIKETKKTKDGLRDAFVSEARRLVRLRHKALPEVKDCFTEEIEFDIPDGNRLGHFLVMEYISGSNLEECMRLQSAPFHLDVVMVWGDQILDALSYLHGLPTPIIHKDVKPANLKLTEGNQIILLDFGLSKSMDEGTFVKGNSKYYSSLEQCKEIATDSRSDLYSVGATLYYLLTGMPPHHSTVREEAINKGQRDPLQSADYHNPQIPLFVARELNRAMALNRDYRHESSEEMRRALKNAWLYQTANSVSNSSVTAPTQLKEFTPPSDDALQEETVHPSLSIVLKRKMAGHRSTVRCVALSGGNNLLASGCENGDIGVWSIPSGGLRVTDKAPNAAVTSLAFSPDGGVIACSRTNNIIEIWDVPSLDLKWKFKAQGLEVHALAISPNGSSIAWGELSKPPAKVQLWSMTTLQFTLAFTFAGHFFIKSLTFSPDGKTLACALWSRNIQRHPYMQGQIQLLDTVTGQSSLLVNDIRANALSYSPDGDILACGSVDKAVRLVDVKSGDLRRMITGHRNSVSSISFSPQRNLLASADLNESSSTYGDVRLWEVDTGLLVRKFDNYSGGVRCVAFSPDGKYLSFATDKIINLYETQ
jgi:serine/threonine protein kinase